MEIEEIDVNLISEIIIIELLQSAQPTSGFDQADCLRYMTKRIHDTRDS
jgi:hypothetical protein